MIVDYHTLLPWIYFLEIKWIARFLFSCLLVPLLLWANPNIIATTKQAEKLFYEKLYGDALPLYSQLTSLSSDVKLKTELILRLATCHLEEKHPQTTLDLLSALDSPFCRNQHFFLMSLAYRQLGKSAQALDLLQQCSQQSSQSAHHLITLEKGYHFLRLGDFINARQAFTSIPWQISNPLPYYLAQLYLAKTFLLIHQYEEALRNLHFLAHALPSQHILHLETLYLKGWILLAQQQELLATACFKKLLPKALASNASWSIQVLNGLIISYLRQALKLDSSHVNQLEALFLKTEQLLQQLLLRAPHEASYLLLSDFYLIQAKCLGNPQSYMQAYQLLNQTELFSSQEGLRYALLKCAAAAPTYQERRRLYQELMRRSDFPLPFCAKVWFLKGLNDFEEGLKFQKLPLLQLKRQPFDEAIQAFTQAIQLEDSPNKKTLALKYLVLTYAHLPESVHAKQAWQILNQFIANDALFSHCEHPAEMYSLAAWIALRLTDQDILQKARSFLQQNQAIMTGSWKERFLKLEGLICLQLREWQQADSLFNQLLQENAYASSHGEAWFWRAYCAEQQEHLSLKKEYLQYAYTQNPQSPYAPIAYFHLYSYREYMQGKRKAIKHLQAMPLLFPSHPLLMSAYYLMGLSHKKDYLNENGQILRRKDWIAAIDAFQLAESTFDALIEKQEIPSSDLAYFIRLRYQTQLERAQANLAIAQASTGGKKQIYLNYAEEVFKQLIHDFVHPEALANQVLIQSDSLYPPIWAEAEFQLAKTYVEKNEWKEAETILNHSLEHYQQAHIVQDYRLMRVWYTKGQLARQQANDEAALECFLEAEKTTHDYLGLSPHEKLELWIQQSLCYQALHQLDQSMRLLSRVINEDVVSPLRIQAMFLRAEIYELQGRPELAIKQLEATAHQGGEWAQKAKEKLEKIYGYSLDITSRSREFL